MNVMKFGIDQLFLTLAILVAGPVLSSAQAQRRVSDVLLTPVHNVLFKDMRTLEVLKAIAERYMVVIGVSGVQIGSDSAGVNLYLAQGTLRDLIDAVVKQDSRFTWRQNDSGSISVLVKNSPLTLVDVSVRAFGVQNPTRLEVSEAVSHIPEISSWLEQHQCEIADIFVGRPPTNRWPISIQTTDKPLWAILDEIASKSGTYFWSLIQYDCRPCSINLRP
jgi:hypothetical protein